MAISFICLFCGTPSFLYPRLLIKLFPDLAKKVFDRCIETNLQTETKQGSVSEDRDQGHWREQVGKKRDCVTADNENFKIVFNFELLDDTYVMARSSPGLLLGSGAEEGVVGKDESFDAGDDELWLENKKLNSKAVTYTPSKFNLKRNHPLMIMVNERRSVMGILWNFPNGNGILKIVLSTCT